MNKIQRMSSFLIAVFNFLLVFLPLSTLCLWAFANSGFMRYLASEGFAFIPTTLANGEVITHWPALGQILGLTGGLLALTPTYIGLLILKVIFKNYRLGNIFTIENARSYKRIGILFFIDALLIKPLSDMVSMFAVTFASPSVVRVLSLSFGTPNLTILLTGALVTMIAWVMLEGCRLNQEQQLTI